MEKQIVLDWHTDYDPNKSKEEDITCQFKLDFKGDKDVKKACEECYEFAIELLKNDPLFSNLKDYTIKNTETYFILELVGRGHDGRCGFCRSVRTKLARFLIEKGIELKEEGSDTKAIIKEEIFLNQNKFCRFDEEEGYWIYQIHFLDRKIKLYEEGFDEESTEEDYEGWKRARIDIIIENLKIAFSYK